MKRGRTDGQLSKEEYNLAIDEDEQPVTNINMWRLFDKSSFILLLLGRIRTG